MSLLSLTQSLLRQSYPILCYHQVRPDSGMTPEKFGLHLDLLLRLGFQSISLARLCRIIEGKDTNPGPSVVITFDDCTLDNWIYAVPELLRREMHGVFFSITDFLVPGKARRRADQGSTASVGDFGEIMRKAMQGHCDGFMNHDELRCLVHDLEMEVYSHSAAHQACFTSTKNDGLLRDQKHWSHSALCALDCGPDTLVHPIGSAYAHNGFGFDWNGSALSLNTHEERMAFSVNDFSRSKTRLEHLLGVPCQFLCLPWGQYDTITLEAARECGFTGVLNLAGGYVGPGVDPMHIGRLAIKDHKSLPWLALKTTLLAHNASASLVRGRRPREQQ